MEFFKKKDLDFVNERLKYKFNISILEAQLTKLQEHYNDNVNKYEELLVKYSNLQKENEKLKENAIHNDKVVDKAKWNEMLYKSRIDKAIEYIKHLDNVFIDDKKQDEILNILEWSDNND